MRVDLLDYELPPELIAQHPAEPREAARLLRVAGGHMTEHRVGDLPKLLQPGDLLVLNDTRVLPTRFFARRGEAAVEVTLVEPIGEAGWWALARPGKRLRPGDRVTLSPGLVAEVVAKREDGAVHLAFDLTADVLIAAIKAEGTMPLPPYIKRERGGDRRDLADYQPLFAARDGSVAAPTASLHLTAGLLAALEAEGVGKAFVTLHVGIGTFAPIKVEDTADHVMHAEWCELPAETVAAIAAARAWGGRIVAVGSTVLRTLESARRETESLDAWQGWTRLCLGPGDPITSADLLLTNFHLPRSTLLMLVAAFVGFERMRALYEHAVRERFRFFSYGDACLLERAA